ncbi:MAG TPA: phosphatase PAP2 family protein [Gemmatimonadales bacterium]|nr:phosphatase PAP2 family protein [Gemmatimonadales bacterium]
MRRAGAFILFLYAPPSMVAAQDSTRTFYRAGWGDVASVGAAGVSYFLPAALNLPKNGPSCVPCDPATLPAIDRGAINPESQSLDVASTVTLVAVGGFTAFESLRGLTPEQWHGNFAVLANSASWTAASVEWIKVLVHRARPVLYTSAAPEAATDLDNVQSFPSGHTALAFAAATTYAVLAARQHFPQRTRNSIILYAGATAVGVLRVLAGKHFPTDVLAGAALGSGIGWVVPIIHPTLP